MITFRGWLAKTARVVKGMDPVPNWHICVQGSRYRTVIVSRKYAAIAAFRSFSRPAHFVTVRRLRDELPACQFDANGLCVSLHDGLRPALRRESPSEPCREWRRSYVGAVPLTSCSDWPLADARAPR
jgi:hypothetical protein